MTDTPSRPDSGAAADAEGEAGGTDPVAAQPGGRALWAAGAVLAALSVVSFALAFYSQQRVRALEQELVRRQQDSQSQAIEARALAKEAQDLSRAADSRVGLLEGRVAENTLQRSQLEELIQQLSRSRDENAMADIEAAVRVAVQQVAITGSAEPLITALRQADERLARINLPRVERVRRALVRDLDRVKAVALSDIATLTIKLDEAVRLVDELPLAAQPERRAAAASGAARGAPPLRAASAPGPVPATPWWRPAADAWNAVAARVWDEVRSLVRVTRIDHPEAMLVAPDQAWFLRENVKLRLLNARLALLSRHFETAQGDLRDVQAALERYFDRSSRRVATAIDLVRQVSGQSRQLSVPRPDETLAAIAAAQAGH